MSNSGYVVRTCADCLAWGRHWAKGRCVGCHVFNRRHDVGDCIGCGRRVALSNGYCRLCWNQARILARESGGEHATVTGQLQQVRYHQLFIAELLVIRRTQPPPVRPPGRPRRPVPPPAVRPDDTCSQLMLFGPLIRDYTSIDERSEDVSGNPWLRWGRYLAHQLGERRGWGKRTRDNVDRGLGILLSRYAPGDAVHYTAMTACLRHRAISSDRVAEVLREMEVLIDDREPAFEHWLAGKLDDLAPGIATDAERWLRCLHSGGPRTKPRKIGTVWNHGNRIRPVLLEWSARYDHLREVTRDDIRAVLAQHHGHARESLMCTLRSLFGHCKRNRVVFRDPTNRIQVSNGTEKVAQPLAADQIQTSIARATRPADRLIIALAAIHAARTAGIRHLQLDDLNLGNRRLTIAGHPRPLDDLTHHLLISWLDFRRARWPVTVNPHLIINKHTALQTTPVSTTWIRIPCRGLHATIERLRIDRQLEEALTHGPDPLHLAAVFGLDPTTAIRYTTAARQLLQTPIETF